MLTFRDRNYVVLLWEKCKNSVKTMLMQIIIFRYYARVLMAFILRPSTVV